MIILLWITIGIVSCIFLVRRNYRNGMKPKPTDVCFVLLALFGPLLTTALIIEWIGKRESRKG